MKTILLSSLLLAGIAFSGCAFKGGVPALETMDKKEASAKLIKGKTTKAEVVAMFGNPEQIDLDPKDNEIYSYSFQRADSTVLDYIPFVDLVAPQKDSIRNTLTVYFKGEVVRTFILNKSSTKNSKSLSIK